eukprot:Protomagalhaensia_wolfi_Nauph_80__2210@NODE_2430_length_1093_cov_211_702087_g1904_i0_p1_GENE_NODE_2430_length_1093_cov_211_702087_g1904_i0NODE_2430_length_1093_cov_211_702087_g1904_i0_p1_ORF_typecomplete_len270_score31_34Spatacsin_C/PF14649_6/0_09_NODE_2430_length_1093_cov_211_702087_g1904_i061870
MRAVGKSLSIEEECVGSLEVVLAGLQTVAYSTKLKGAYNVWAADASELPPQTVLFDTTQSKVYGVVGNKSPHFTHACSEESLTEHLDEFKDMKNKNLNTMDWSSLTRLMSAMKRVQEERKEQNLPAERTRQISQTLQICREAMRQMGSHYLSGWISRPRCQRDIPLMAGHAQVIATMRGETLRLKIQLPSLIFVPTLSESQQAQWKLTAMNHGVVNLIKWRETPYAPKDANLVIASATPHRTCFDLSGFHSPEFRPRAILRRPPPTQTE